jgi:hypothetical protein
MRFLQVRNSRGQACNSGSRRELMRCRFKVSR